MAKVYSNLGNVYTIRGDLDRAKAMYQKALEINEAMSRKEGMAINYANLANIYKTRGDLDRAKVMYSKALALFQQLGAKRESAQVRQALDALRRQ
jgi:tetratricopeptide (TPR) repeat protein